MTVRLPAWLQAGSYSAEVDRSVGTAVLSPTSALGSRGGVRYYTGAEFFIQQTAPTTAMSVDVTPGMAFVPGSYSITQGVYTVTNDALFTVSIAAANSSLPRIDLIILEVLDQVYSGASNLAQVRAVAGTPASTPATPTVTGAYIPLAQVLVPAGATSIVNSNITDLRPFGALLNQPIPVRNQVERDSLAHYEGLQVYRLDNGWEVNTYSGSSWYGSQERYYNVTNFSTYSGVTSTGSGRVIVDRVKIPDPGWSYMLHMNMDNEVGNARVNAVVYCESSNTSSFSNVVASGQSLSSPTLSGSPNRLGLNRTFPAIYTGNRWVSVKYYADSSDLNGWYNDSYNWFCQIRLIPVLPSTYTATASTGGAP